ncbi:branched-chain amino acid ABC transporter permease [Xanthobacter pseudotagetidis]|uniref:branched-chain amino acid ABC transporter permease n=1 Tax=Xanthobacter pseudotagetidis TaxID=3119911 RepID=UPI00372780C6
MLTLSFALSTLAIGVVYAVLALAVVFVYRASRVLVFCVGEIGAVAAYVLRDGWVIAGTGVQGFLVGVAAALAVAALIGAALYLLVERLNPGGDHFIGTILTVAAGVVLLGLLAAGWGGEISRLPIRLGFTTIAGTRVPVLTLTVIAIGAVLLTLVLALLRHSDFGIESQALSSNRGLAYLRGIPVNRRLLSIWVLAAVFSAIGGMLSAAFSSVSIEGASVGLSGIVAAIIGGLTNPAGAVLGAFLLALAENLTTAWFDARYSQVVPILSLLALLIVRPRGIGNRVESIERV